MTLFLTSDPMGRDRMTPRGTPCPFRDQNGFLGNLRKNLPEAIRVLFIASDPENYERTDMAEDMYKAALELSGFTVPVFDLWDNRYPDRMPGDYDLIILSGGHVPTENAFFRKIGLKEKLRDFGGVVLGISAGSMNCAGTVYAQPEINGEAIDPDYQRFIPGLGLTDINILPHWEMIRNDLLDGLHLTWDITLPDSMGRRFLCIPDGSYVLVKDGVSTLYGQGELAAEGVLTEICRNGETKVLS